MIVLLTCAGRRNYLVIAFREALDGRGEVCAADASPHAPALQEADRAFLVPPLAAPGYVEHLLALCRTHGVRLLVSLNDLELPLLAAARERFAALGTIAVVPSAEAVRVCSDKWATAEFLRRIGVAAPATYLSLADACRALERGEVGFPLVLKPRWGTASIGVEYVEDAEEMDLAYRFLTRRLRRTIVAGPSAADPTRAVLIQERLQGDECGLDVVNDLEGRHVVTLGRRKLAMRAGETDRAVTVQAAALAALGATIGAGLAHPGPLDCDVFVAGERCTVLEMNPRFGGGYPFSHAAGANVPAALIAWARGTRPEPGWLRPTPPGVAAAKCDRIVVVEARGAGATTPLAGSFAPGDVDGARRHAGP